MKIIFFGDIVGRPGREAVKKIIPQLKKAYQPDFIIGNGENVAHGSGITEATMKELLEAGLDLITLGDHALRKKEAFRLLEDKEAKIIRPANFPPQAPGRGCQVIKVRTKKIMVVNLIGRVFMKQDYDCPFRKANEILQEQEESLDGIVVDWHAEATSEKVCLGWHLDGRVSAVLGTHTHVQTADARILPQGTAYLSDVGMTGVKDSSLGLNKEEAIKRFITQAPSNISMASGPSEASAVLVEIGQDKKAKKIKPLQEAAAND